MAEDVLVRLKLAGEQLGEQVRGSFTGLKAEAESAGAEAGRALSQGVKAGADKVTSATTMAARGVTEYEVALLRNTQAIDRFAVEHAQANTTINQAKAALKSGEITQAEYTATTLKAKQGLVQLQAELRETSAELNASAAASRRAEEGMRGVSTMTGMQRAGFQQLAMNVSDMTTMYSLGARPAQIFASQMGQIVQATQLTLGGTSKLAGFLTGGWGIALTSAVLVLAPFVGKLFESEDAADRSERASRSLTDVLGDETSSYEEVTKALDEYNRSQEKSREVTLLSLRAQAEQIKRNYDEAISIREKTKAKLKEFDTLARDPAVLVDETMGPAIASTRAGLSADIERMDAEIGKLGEANRNTQIELSKSLADLQTDGAKRIKSDFEIARAAVIALVPAGEQLTVALTKLNSEEQAALETLRESTRQRGTRKVQLSEEQKAYRDAYQDAERYIAGLQAETERLTLTDGALRQLEVARAKDAAATDDQRRRIEEANAAREEAISLQKREAAAKQAQEGEKDFSRRVDAIDREIALLGMVGPARERAALALEEEAFKADLAAKGVENVNEKWEEYSRKRLQAISGQEMIEAEREAARIREESLRELSGLYEELFTGGTGRIWDDFKRQGSRILAEVAAQYSLALISGQSAGSVGDVMASAGSRSPLGAIFGRTAANDNQVLSGAGLPDFGFGGRSKLPTGTIDESGAIGAGSGDILVTGNRPASLLDNAGIAIAAATVANSIGIGGGGKTAGLIGMAGSIGGQALGSTLGFLGAAGGPIGAIAGAVVGNLIGGLFKKTKYGTASISSADSLSTQGKGSGRAEDAGTLGGAVQDQLRQISEALGVDLGGFRVSIGTYKDSFRVSTTGRTGKLKGGNADVHDFATEQAAIEYAVRDAIKDGALQGLSAASQAVLNKASDLNEALDKVLLIESVPKLLRERLDPLGAALDKVDAKFRDLAEALQEGGASAEQVAEARKLWELERADAIKQIGEASAGLKDFLQSLKAGSDSPLSLRQQKAEADKALDPYVLAIEQAKSAQAEVERLKAGGAGADAVKAAEDAARTAAAGIDQEGFQQAAQLVLGLSRQINASSGGFFADFDRISALTGAGIAAIDAATPQAGAAQDPFTQATAANTQTIADQLTETNKLLKALNDNNVTTSNNKLGWISESRGYY